ncbi:MAG: ATP-binding protein [Christensenellaceae bacterium]|jgi:anti-sigma regulatory factor (Ser/Thr protein kinase)|nr:ATP-binding protein [Christensenellaceae bacterium]
MTSGENQTFQEVRTVERSNFAAAGQISSYYKNVLKKLGVHSGVVRRVAIASYEAEINLAIHSWGGSMALTIYPDRIHLLIQDVGPGIADVDRAMQEGYSTASEEVRMLGFGAGMGLPNMRRCSDAFEISSAVGAGTTVNMDFNLLQEQPQEQ